MNERKHYIDNIRWVTVVMVIIYHAVYMYNSVGVITNISVKGIPQLDALLYFLYPWFMILLFVVAGMSARYSLEKRSGKEFMAQRAKTILVPSIVGIFAYGWINGWVTNQYTDMFGGQGDLIPGFIKALIYCMSGIGPLWFAQELFLACAVLMLVRAIDKKGKLYELGGKVNAVIAILLVIPVWGSAQIFNTPIIEIYRNGIYIFCFLLGYYVFSHEEVTDKLVKIKIPLLIAAVALGVAYTVVYFGRNYSEMAILKNIFTNVYAWAGVLAVIACFKAWCNKTNKFAAYMTKRNFSFYILHYSFLVTSAWLADKVLHFPSPSVVNYLFILAVTAVMLPIAYELLSRIPVIRSLILGIYKKK